MQTVKLDQTAGGFSKNEGPDPQIESKRMNVMQQLGSDPQHRSTRLSNKNKDSDPQIQLQIEH